MAKINFETLVVIVVLISAVNCLTKQETYALTRDGMSRPNPDALFHGFFPVWPLILLSISGSFFVIAIIAFIGYATGLCRAPTARYIPAVNK